jgi:hypothetical protein
MRDVMRNAPRVVAMVLLVVAATVLPCTRASAQEDVKRVNPDAKAIADFQEEIKEYLELRRKLARKLPPVPDDATPEQLDTHQRALARLIQQARRSEKVGDIFERDIRPVFRRLLHGVFSGPDGRKMRMAIMEENPGEVVRLAVNSRYPDTIPLSNMPPQVLRILPPLPEELEYRFIGTTLILFDTVAHIIVDYITDAVPR